MNIDYVDKRTSQQEIEQYNNYSEPLFDHNKVPFSNVILFQFLFFLVIERLKVQMKPDNLLTEEKETNLDPRSRQCPYLDTINRNVLDFDFEKLCSITLSNNNVYACLVCGKYFQGRGMKSHAYTHSVQMSHHVYINLNTLKFYCLPDNYQVIDSSLDDIKVS